MNCPDCKATLALAATKCRCGWKALPAIARVFCDTPGCEERAYRRIGGRNICEACEERQRHERSATFCESRGLKTVDDMRAFCTRMARSFSRGVSFESWAARINQRTVDLVVLHNGKGDQRLLERLREAGAIDERNQVIAVELRARVRQARAAARKVERRRAEAELAANGIAGAGGQPTRCDLLAVRHAFRESC